jgi:hypothetical protein
MKNMPTKSTDEEIETPTPKKETKDVSLVPLSEDFQKRVMEIVSGCSEQECSFICSQCYKRQDELRKENETQEDVSMDDYKKVTEAGE